MTAPAALTDMRTELAETVDRLTAELATTLGRLEKLDQLLATYDDEPVDDEPVIVPPVTEPAPPAPLQIVERRRESEPRVAGGVTCPDCGARFHHERGLSIHRGQKHKDKPAHVTPAAVKAPAPLVVVAPAVGDTRPSTRTVYRCSDIDCGTEVRSLIDIAAHTTSEHGRRPTAGERILVTPDNARSAQ